MSSFRRRGTGARPSKPFGHTNGPGHPSGGRSLMPRFPPIPAKSTPETVERAPRLPKWYGGQAIHHVKERHDKKNK